MFFQKIKILLNQRVIVTITLIIQKQLLLQLLFLPIPPNQFILYDIRILIRALYFFEVTLNYFLFFQNLISVAGALVALTRFQRILQQTVGNRKLV